MKKSLMFLGTLVLCLAVSPASAKAVKGISSSGAQHLCPGSFCQQCVHEGGVCSQGADTCFCTFG